MDHLQARRHLVQRFFSLTGWPEETRIMIIAKLNNSIVEIVKYAHDVRFSQDKGWLLIDPDRGEPDMTGSTRESIKWIPASTRFEWVKSFNFR